MTKDTKALLELLSNQNKAITKVYEQGKKDKEKELLEKAEREDKEIEQFLSYACKEGHLEPDDIKDWTRGEKLDYFNKSQAFEPDEN